MQNTLYGLIRSIHTLCTAHTIPIKSNTTYKHTVFLLHSSYNPLKESRHKICSLRVSNAKFRTIRFRELEASVLNFCVSFSFFSVHSLTLRLHRTPHFNFALGIQKSRTYRVDVLWTWNHTFNSTCIKAHDILFHNVGINTSSLTTMHMERMICAMHTNAKRLHTR